MQADLNTKPVANNHSLRIFFGILVGFLIGGTLVAMYSDDFGVVSVVGLVVGAALGAGFVMAITRAFRR